MNDSLVGVANNLGLDRVVIFVVVVVDGIHFGQIVSAVLQQSFPFNAGWPPNPETLCGS